ncbi:MAG: SGNH/GDSL hydrolase family protein [Kiritimatiellia bacterium]
MQVIQVSEPFIQGALSVKRVGDVIYPCRLPYQRRHLFPSPGDSLMDRALCASGVRLRLQTDAESVSLTFAPLAAPNYKVIQDHVFDVVIDNEIVQSVHCPEAAREVVFDRIGAGLRTIELWLPPSCPVGLKKLKARKATIMRPLPDRRPLWVTWGSSITHCVRAGSAARTWPATVARKHNLNLLSLGFGGACHLDPTVAMVIRDLPASYISMKLGINAVSNSLSTRTYPALVTAAVAIVREKHPYTPVALISPIASPPRENTPTQTGYTLEGMRADMAAVHRNLTMAGDMRLYYVSGMDLFGMDDIQRYATDLLHPNAEGMDLQAQRFSELVMPLLQGG